MHIAPDTGSGGRRDGRFDGMVAVVTGGSNGLGRAIARGFADEGARVMICDLVDSGYFAGNPAVATVTGDIGRPGLADEVIAAAVSRWGQADILVNDAASYPDGTLLEMPGEAWDRVFRVNVTGTFLITQAFARHCVDRHAQDAAVVSISSGSARTGSGSTWSPPATSTCASRATRSPIARLRSYVRRWSARSRWARRATRRTSRARSCSWPPGM